MIKVIYGDTDSIFLTGLDNAEEFAKQLTIHLRKFTKQKYGVEIPVFMGVDRVFSRFYITEVKKRYIGKDKQTGKIIVKGYEKKRRDWVQLAKIVQDECFTLILGDVEDIAAAMRPFLHQIYADLVVGKHDDKIIFSKKLRKDLADYKMRSTGESSLPPHVRAAKQLEDEGMLEAFGVVRYVVVSEGYTGKGKTRRHVLKVEPITDKMPTITFTGYTYIWQHQIEPILERLDINIDELDYIPLGKFLAMYGAFFD